LAVVCPSEGQASSEKEEAIVIEDCEEQISEESGVSINEVRK
jgi:hypothetical protein